MKYTLKQVKNSCKAFHIFYLWLWHPLIVVKPNSSRLFYVLRCIFFLISEKQRNFCVYVCASEREKENEKEWNKIVWFHWHSRARNEWMSRQWNKTNSLFWRRRGNHQKQHKKTPKRKRQSVSKNSTRKQNSTKKRQRNW